MSIVTQAPATQLPAGTWSIDPVWSALEFEVKKLGLMTVKGRVPGFEGEIEGGESPSIRGVVDATSITTFDEQRDGHLQSPDFFDTARFPQLRFESTKLTFHGDEVAVAGDLTIKGVTKPVKLRGRFVGSGQDAYGNERIGLELEGAVDRNDFGLTWNAPLPGGGLLLPDDVTLKATFAAVRAA